MRGMTRDKPGGALRPTLPAPARRALEHAGYTRLSHFCEVTEAELLKLHGMGPTAVAAIRAALEENGLSFAG
jgi:hypothetical protein